MSAIPSGSGARSPYVQGQIHDTSSCRQTADKQILGHSDIVDSETNRAFLLSSQSPLGGFGKEPGDYPDPFHSYLALAALALSHSGRELALGELDASWNLSRVTAGWLRGEIARIAES
jgi:geranylgeranyl transferase type-1 subunit beta